MAVATSRLPDRNVPSQVVTAARKELARTENEISARNRLLEEECSGYWLIQSAANMKKKANVSVSFGVQPLKAFSFTCFAIIVTQC